MNWRTPDWQLAQLVTLDGPVAMDAIEEYRRRIARKHGDCLCDEILKPEAYLQYPLGVDGPYLDKARIKELEGEIEDIEYEIAGLKSDLRDKEDELARLRRGQSNRFY